MNSQYFSKIWIIVIFIIVIGGGILAWQYFWVPKETIKTLEETAGLKIEYGTFNSNGFSVDYPQEWIPRVIEDKDPRVEVIANFEKGDYPDSCNETATRKTIEDLKNFKKDIEAFISSSKFSLLESNIRTTPKGEKYIASFEFIQNEIKHRQHLIAFNCEDYTYQVGIMCSGKELKKDYEQVISHIFESISCKSEEEEKEITNKEKIVKIIQMFQNIKREARAFYVLHGDSYSGFSCESSNGMKIICENIEKNLGTKPVIYTSKEAYCAYIKHPLIEEPPRKAEYYCIKAKLGYMGVDGFAEINPGQKGYCDGTTFICP